MWLCSVTFWTRILFSSKLRSYIRDNCWISLTFNSSGGFSDSINCYFEALIHFNPQYCYMYGCFFSPLEVICTFSSLIEQNRVTRYMCGVCHFSGLLLYDVFFILMCVEVLLNRSFYWHGNWYPGPRDFLSPRRDETREKEAASPRLFSLSSPLLQKLWL